MNSQIGILEDHPHSHDHAHEHSEKHFHSFETEQSEKTLIDKFFATRGRIPTKEELVQLKEHGHIHEHFKHPGFFFDRDMPIFGRNYNERAFTIGIGGPVGSGKTALMLQLCRSLRNDYSVAAVTNDIFTREDGEFLLKYNALEPERIVAVETGGCPHAAVREDISANLKACEDLTRRTRANLVLVESGGDNLAANFSRELADYIIYVIDVAGGDKIPRKGGPGITQADLLVINKTDLAEAVGADLDVMARDAKKMRGDGPTVFAQVKNSTGVEEIIQYILAAFEKNTKPRIDTIEKP